MSQNRDPQDWDLSVPELAMILKDVKYGSARLSFLIKHYYVDQQTASYWIKLVRDYEQEREAS